MSNLRMVNDDLLKDEKYSNFIDKDMEKKEIIKKMELFLIQNKLNI